MESFPVLIQHTNHILFTSLFVLIIIILYYLWWIICERVRMNDQLDEPAITYTYACLEDIENN